MSKLVTRRHVISTAAGLAAAASLPRTTQASAVWRPKDTVRLVVPAAAGGSTDVMARLLAAHLQSAWKQNTVVENRSGGGGTIGVGEVARLKGDGHTILVSNPGPNAIAYSIFKKMTYKPEQLIPVSNMIRIPNIVSAHPSVPIKTIPELIAYIKAKPGKLTYGSAGVGQSPHLAAAWFLQLTGLSMTHVPFRGSGPALQGALAGDVQILFDNLYPTLPQVVAGNLNALAVTSRDPIPQAPAIPAMRQTAPELADYDLASWFGVFYPSGTPIEAVSALNDELRILLAKAETKTMFNNMGGVTDYGSPEQYTSFINSEILKFKGIIDKEGLQMDVK